MKAPFHLERRTRGFTLIEIVVVMVIISILAAMAALITRAVSSQQRRSTTITRMATVDTALHQFVMVQKRLPCPADGTLASSDPNAGTEGPRDTATGCTTTQANGVVPWRAIGLSETDASDAWDRRLTFRVPQNLTIDNMLDMSQCDPAGGGGAAANGSCAAGCTAATLITCTSPTAFLSAPTATVKGFPIQNVAGTEVMSLPNTGAAYVVISHGETGGGGMLSSGVVFAGTTTDGTQEKLNYVDKALRAYYVDDSLAEGPGVTHFDDIVSRPTLLSIVNKAGLAPRPHP